jgi:inhibitor of cysteine peptidase
MWPAMLRGFSFLPLVPVLLVALARPARPESAPRVFTDSDKGATVELNIGDTFELRLKANPSTGFMWYLQKESTRLAKFRSQTQTEPADPVMPGQPIFQVFRFEVVGSGDGVVLLHYVRSWEKPTDNDTQFNLHIVVH